MSKVIEQDGKHYRMRRGKLVEIPEEWLGKTTSKKTIRQRKSKRLHKHRRCQPKSETTKGIAR